MRVRQKLHVARCELQPLNQFRPPRPPLLFQLSDIPALPYPNPAMNVIRFTDPDFSVHMRQLAAASSLFDRTIEDRARAICDAVQTQGDAAVLEFTERFDGAKLTAEQLPVTKA